MPRSAASIIAGALQIAKIPLYTAQALDGFNSLLRYIEDTIDFSAARGQWNFYFNTNIVSSGAGNIIQSAGNPLPIDYLRVQVSGGSSGAQRSSKWYFSGVPYDMVEVDLTEFDDQVQQAGIQSYPYFWAKDLSQYQPIVEISGDLDAISGTVTNISPITDALGNVIGSTAALAIGQSIAGGIGPRSVIAPGSIISAIAAGPPLILTLASPIGEAPISASLAGASMLVGNPGIGLPYPPPSGSYPVMIRYQRRMPRMTQAQVNAGAYPWFSDNDIALEEGLAGLMSRFSDDSRTNEFIGAGLGSGEGRFGKYIARYLKTADDNSNRAQVVQLDRRAFGRSFSALKNTKTVGW
jgi:hypothetical protein